MFPFFNYYFAWKGFGVGMWAWTNWLLFSRFITRDVAKNETMTRQEVAHNVLEGEDKIIAAMSRFGNDSRCLEELNNFKADVTEGMAEYRKAILETEKTELLTKARKQLQAIATFEDGVN